MKKLTNFLQHNAFSPDNFVIFPYDELVLAPWGSFIFVRFVDAEFGNDNNDGFTFRRAKKTINAAIGSLPQDLNGYEARIFVHPGTYTNIDNNPVIYIPNINGDIKFCWLGTWANPGDPDFVDNAGSQFLVPLLGGLPVRSNNKIVINAQNVTNGHGCCFSASWSNNYSLRVFFESQNFYKSWNDPAANYAYRWKFIGNNTNTTDTIFCSDRLKQIDIVHPIEVDSSGFNGLFVLFFNSPYGNINGIVSIVNSLGRPHTNASYWEGFIALGSNTTSNFNVLNRIWFPNGGYHPDYPEPSNGKNWLIRSVRNAFIFHNNANANLGILDGMIYEQGLLPDGNLPFIYLAENSEPTVSFHSDYLRINNLCTKPYKITDVKTNTTVISVGAGLKNVNNNFITSVNNSNPADSLLANKDIAFWIDETNNKLKIKVKYSNGSIKNGEINLL